MAISMANMMRASVIRPPRLLVYGVSGIGKTTLGMCAPKPVFLQTEDSAVDVPTFGLLRTYGQVMEAIGALYDGEHDRETVVLDSMDWLEPLVWAETCAANQWRSIETPGFGKGFAAAVDTWRLLLDGLNALREERNMAVIMLAHSEIKRFESPDTEGYDRYQIKLQKAASALVQEHADCVLFANYDITTVTKEGAFNKKAVKGVNGKNRLLFTTERPSALAKNRYDMPDKIPLEWGAISSCIPFFNQANKVSQNVEGKSNDTESESSENDTEAA